LGQTYPKDDGGGNTPFRRGRLKTTHPQKAVARLERRKLNTREQDRKVPRQQERRFSKKGGGLARIENDPRASGPSEVASRHNAILSRGGKKKASFMDRRKGGVT